MSAENNRLVCGELTTLDTFHPRDEKNLSFLRIRSNKMIVCFFTRVYTAYLCECCQKKLLALPYIKWIATVPTIFMTMGSYSSHKYVVATP